MLGALLGTVVAAALAADLAPPSGSSGDQRVPAATVASAEDRKLVGLLDPGTRPCAVWRAELPDGVRAVLAALCTGDGLRGPATWKLYVAGGETGLKRLERVTLGGYPYAGCIANGSLRVRDDILLREKILEVGWGCRSEGDGIYPAVELWRWNERRLHRLLRVPSSSGGADLEAATWGVWWRPLPGEDGAPCIEVTWIYGFRATDTATGWKGEQRLRYRLDGAAFRPPAGALLMASSWASSWLPMSGVSTYAPPLAFDGQVETAWCARAASNPRISIRLAEPTRLQDVRIVPGYGKSEQQFRDNARVARVRIQALGERGDATSFQADLADDMSAQEIPVPERVGKVVGLKVELVRIRPGRVYRDVCVSQIQVIPRPEARP